MNAIQKISIELSRQRALREPGEVNVAAGGDWGGRYTEAAEERGKRPRLKSGGRGGDNR